MLSEGKISKREYRKLHKWLRENKIKPKFCEDCGIKEPEKKARQRLYKWFKEAAGGNRHDRDLRRSVEPKDPINGEVQSAGEETSFSVIQEVSPFEQTINKPTTDDITQKEVNVFCVKCRHSDTCPDSYKCPPLVELTLQREEFVKEIDNIISLFNDYLLTLKSLEEIRGKWQGKLKEDKK